MVGIIQSFECPNRIKSQKKKKRANFLSSWAGTPIFACVCILEVMVLGPSASDGFTSQDLLLQWSEVKVTQSCPTLWDPMDYTVHGILQARPLEWLAFPISRGSSQPRDRTQVSLIAGGFFTSWATGELYHQLCWFSSLQMVVCGISQPQ